ncbi:MAG TPA: hypothetical protein VHT91_11255 [Kofleriaceae bacterium]|nr:hypothetical protein [Kofleriaceae bacterium]
MRCTARCARASGTSARSTSATADGALYVSDDLGGRVFKITYGK